MDTLPKRAKRKIVSQAVALELVDVAVEKGAKDRQKMYWNTYHCQSRLVTSEGKLFGNYCKNRFCGICSAIRKAELINKYLPVIKDWERPYLVTLTVRAVAGNRLHGRMDRMLESFRKIVAKYKKRHQRYGEKRLMGLRALECNFNEIQKTYNPHFHLIVADEESAQIIIEEWLAYWGPKDANAGAQHYREVRDREAGLAEVIKYSCKTFVEPGAKRPSKGKRPYKIHVRAMDTILAAFKGKRLFDRFGFNLPKAAAKETLGLRVAEDGQEWVFDTKELEWLNAEHEAPLSGYAGQDELRGFLEGCIDRNSE